MNQNLLQYLVTVETENSRFVPRTLFRLGLAAALTEGPQVVACTVTVLFFIGESDGD